jgi:hypothetical protein
MESFNQRYIFDLKDFIFYSVLTLTEFQIGLNSSEAFTNYTEIINGNITTGTATTASNTILGFRFPNVAILDDKQWEYVSVVLEITDDL